MVEPPSTAPQRSADREPQIASRAAGTASNSNVLHANVDYVDFDVRIRKIANLPLAQQDTDSPGGLVFGILAAAHVSPPRSASLAVPRARKRRLSEAFTKQTEKRENQDGVKPSKRKRTKWLKAKKRAQKEARKLAEVANGTGLPWPARRLQPQRSNPALNPAPPPFTPTTGPPLSSELHIYTDGSMIVPKHAVVPRALGFGLAWRTARGWKGLCCAVGYRGDQIDNNDAESFAIDEALELAFETHSSTALSKVTIWTDSSYAKARKEVDFIAACQLYRDPERRSVHLMRTLIDGDVQIDVNLIKSHSGILGNRYADDLARLGSEWSIACHSGLKAGTASSRLCFNDASSLNKLPLLWRPITRKRRAHEAMMRSKEMAIKGDEKPVAPSVHA